MVNLFIRLGMIGAGITVTGFYGTILLNYAFEILREFALLLVVIVGMWVAGFVFLILFLKSRTNPILKLLGEVLGKVMMYSTLFQGVLYTALVFMVIGTFGGFAELADSANILIYDLVFGMGYLSVLIYGSASIVILLTYYRFRTRILGTVYGVLSIAMTLFSLLSQSQALRELAMVNLTVFTVGSVAYFLVWSVLFMSILGEREDPSYQRKADLKRRLKASK